jgi:hypothetical protein
MDTNGRIAWTDEKRKLGDLLAWPKNPRQIDRKQGKRLVESFEEFGQVETLAIGPSNELYNGHQRLNVLMQQYGPGYEVDVRVASRALTEKEREKLTIYLHKGAAGTWDFDILADRFEQDDLLAWGFEPFELGQHEIPPTLDELGDEYGDHSEESFWPYIRVQVSPETKELFDSLWRDAPGDTDTDKMAALLGAVDAAALGAE